jgi:hypothetical protein
VALVYRDMLTHVWDEMEYRYLPYNQSWTNWAFEKKKKKHGEIMCISVQ